MDQRFGRFASVPHLAAAFKPLTRSSLLCAYFRSGWAFFIPYLAAYLFYAWLRWPVNPVERSGWIAPPCLLHVYWALHTLHVVLGIAALRSWWGSVTTRRQPSAAILSLTPWFCLALLFLIPGIYLEWPSDPWEHLRRINEWHGLDHVTAHSTWRKSSYFLPYSLTGHRRDLGELGGLNLYYTTVALLLSWQYYRLARAVGLGARASFVVVILNALAFGNSIFSFHRYYGLSSSILAQITAIACVRCALTALCAKDGKPQSPSKSVASRDSTSSLGRPLQVLRSSSPLGSFCRAIPSLLLLLGLTACNHVQGVAIAGLGLLAVALWRMIEWKRQMVGWLGMTALILSIATLLWFPRHPALDAVYHPQGWLTAWGGFNFFSPSSPTVERAMQIWGALGAFELCIGLWLIVRRNHVAGWLALIPVAVLSCPLGGLPFAHVLSTHSSPLEGIVAFHRVLFLASPGLAVLALAAATRLPNHRGAAPSREPRDVSKFQWPLMCILLTSLVVLAPGTPTYGRLWHLIHVPSEDLQLREAAGAIPRGKQFANPERALVIASLPAREMRSVFAETFLRPEFRQIHDPIDLAAVERQIGWLTKLRADSSWVPLLERTLPNSQLNELTLIRRDRETGLHEEQTSRSVTATDWIDLASPADQRKTLLGRTTVGNEEGKSGDFFTADLIPIMPNRRYRISSTICEFGDGSGSNYLAVAWYDGEKRSLISNVPKPAGAGEPAGWSNGTYSYYGLTGGPASDQPMRYSVSFGLGEFAEIPSQARYVRFGALLNYRSSPQVRAELSGATLIEKAPHSHVDVTVPQPRLMISPKSQAGHLSSHWPAHYVATTFAGSKELQEAVEHLVAP